MNAPNAMLKVIVMVHFILSTWASMGAWLPLSHTYVHIGVLACGLWAIAASESVDAVLMMLMTLLFSIVQDVILISLYEPRGYSAYESSNDRNESQVNEFRFALGMCILNLILKPFSAFLLFRIYQSRSNDTAFIIPGIDRIPGLGGLGGGVGGYENIDRGSAPPYTHVPVEAATGHSMEKE